LESLNKILASYSILWYFLKYKINSPKRPKGKVTRNPRGIKAIFSVNDGSWEAQYEQVITGSINEVSIKKIKTLIESSIQILLRVLILIKNILRVGLVQKESFSVTFFQNINA